MVARTPREVLKSSLGAANADEALAALAFHGYAVVPIHPTQAMLDEVCSSDGIEPWTDKIMTETYETMIRAFP